MSGLAGSLRARWGPAVLALVALSSAGYAWVVGRSAIVPAAIVPAEMGSASIGSAAMVSVAMEPQRFRFPAPPEVEYHSFDYDGRFTFARIKFRPTFWGFGDYHWGLDLKWNHDYPQAELNFMKILDELTGVVPQPDGGNILEISDPRLFQHPWAYLCEPGFWNPSEEDLAILREYLAKGGFLVIDDFFDQPGRTAQWSNFELQIKRLYPAVQLFKLDVDQPIFRSFFELDDLEFPDARMPWFTPHIYGIFEDNDPSKRLLSIINYNLDIGDYWEWSDTEGVYPLHLTEKGFKLGVNYVIYGMTH